MFDQINLSADLIEEYRSLFRENDIPIAKRKRKTKKADRIVMISTHGYWGDPPPAGVPDTGGQTYYVLEVSKAWAKQGKKVIILARWFKPYPRVEKFAKNLWLIRIEAGGDEFIRKEDIYPFVPRMAEAATAVATLFGANSAIGHYADGMTCAVEVAERLQVPVINIPHSMGIRKVENLGFDPLDPETWLDPQYNFWTRESLELTSLNGTNLEVANTPAEPAILKKYYNIEFPHMIMPAGAGKDYFDAYTQRPNQDILKPYGLRSEKYLIFFGRLSEAKNISGVVAVFGEARKLEPAFFKQIKLAIVGGNPDDPQAEEAQVEGHIREAMDRYSLDKKDVIRIPSKDWKELSVLAYHGLFYVGMQMMEPFGMAVAEAMASGTPVMISRIAGIARWLKNGEHALIVDPEKPHEAAEELVRAVRDRALLKQLSVAGRNLAKENFSWPGIAKRLATLLDILHRGEIPTFVENNDRFSGTFTKRKNRAYHRLAFVWRGDPPIIKPQHKKAANGLVQPIIEAVRDARSRGKRAIIGLGGESGAGKTEVAEYLRYLLRKENIWGMTLPGDAFFRLTPAENHAARLKAHAEGRLEQYLGPNEVNLDLLDSILKTAIDRKNDTIYLPSDCRSLGSRRYEEVPAEISNRDLVLVDLTYSLLLKHIDARVFFESDYKKRLEDIKKRNMVRDPDQDFGFIVEVLKIEHHIIQQLKGKADIIITKDYDVTRKDS